MHDLLCLFWIWACIILLGLPILVCIGCYKMAQSTFSWCITLFRKWKQNVVQLTRVTTQNSQMESTVPSITQEHNRHNRAPLNAPMIPNILNAPSVSWVLSAGAPIAPRRVHQVNTQNEAQRQRAHEDNPPEYQPPPAYADIFKNR